MKKTFAALALAASLMPFASAQAAVISFSKSVGMEQTDWFDTPLALGKFDTRLGTLTSIEIALTGFVEGTGVVENTGKNPTIATLRLGSTLRLMRPDGSTLVVSNPLFSKNFNLSAFDGKPDFQGSSSATTGPVTAQKTEFFVSDNASEFALFSAKGGGNIELLLTALGNSEAFGSGNIGSLFSTNAAGAAQVTYTYTPFVVEVPEPATLATLVAGLGLMGAVRRRARKAAR